MYILSIFVYICTCSIWLYKPRKSSYGLANLELFNQHLLEDPPPTKKPHLPIINSPVVVDFSGKKLKIFSKSRVFWDLIYPCLRFWLLLPGLVNIQKAIENGPVEIVDLPMNSKVIFHSYEYVKLPEGICATVKFFLCFIFYVFVDPSTMTGMAKWAFGKFPMKINLAEWSIFDGFCLLDYMGSI